MLHVKSFIKSGTEKGGTSAGAKKQRGRTFHMRSEELMEEAES